MTNSVLTYHHHYNSNRNGVFAFVPAKQFKAVNNSISKVIRVMVAKPEDSV